MHCRTQPSCTPGPAAMHSRTRRHALPDPPPCTAGPVASHPDQTATHSGPSRRKLSDIAARPGRLSRFLRCGTSWSVARTHLDHPRPPSRQLCHNPDLIQPPNHSTTNRLTMYPYAMDLQGITITVSNLERSRQFYEGELGLEPGDFYSETRWQPYKINGQFFAIREVSSLQQRTIPDLTEFWVDDVATLWERLRDRAEIFQSLAMTPWGSYKFIIKDPDGYLIGLVQRQPE
jgi:catechol 2,3-dioxygenase-like lactoylglutathione lyase family enzyme